MGNRLLAAGNLDRRVTIERATMARDSAGQKRPNWAPHLTRFASARPAPGTERFANAENAASAPMRFVFRWEDGLVTVEDRLLHDDGRRYDIQSVSEIGRHEGWEVLATASADVA